MYLIRCFIVFIVYSSKIIDSNAFFHDANELSKSKVNTFKINAKIVTGIFIQEKSLIQIIPPLLLLKCLN